MFASGSLWALVLKVPFVSVRKGQSFTPARTFFLLIDATSVQVCTQVTTECHFHNKSAIVSASSRFTCCIYFDFFPYNLPEDRYSTVPHVYFTVWSKFTLIELTWGKTYHIFAKTCFFSMLHAFRLTDSQDDVRTHKGTTSYFGCVAPSYQYAHIKSQPETRDHNWTGGQAATPLSLLLFECLYWQKYCSFQLISFAAQPGLWSWERNLFHQLKG